jgi:ribosomal protein S18 acetylase RimI-like enzyme
VNIRPVTAADTDAVVELWRAVFPAYFDPAVPQRLARPNIERKLAFGDGLFWLAEEQGAVVGTVMAGYDGHRGWINYLACHPNHRRHGVAKSLMNEAKKLLTERGCPKINLQVRSGNESAVKFYESIGYLDDNVTSFGLRLNPDN